jgi:hypothetical protein
LRAIAALKIVVLTAVEEQEPPVGNAVKPAAVLTKAVGTQTVLTQPSLARATKVKTIKVKTTKVKTTKVKTIKVKTIKVKTTVRAKIRVVVRNVVRLRTLREMAEKWRQKLVLTP